MRKSVKQEMFEQFAKEDIFYYMDHKVKKGKELKVSTIEEVFTLVSKIGWPYTLDAFEIEIPILEEIVRMYPSEIRWDIISRRSNLTEDFVRRYKDKIDWKIFLYEPRPGFSEEFFREHSNYLNWEAFSRNQKLTMSFIKDFSNKINWRFLSTNKNLTSEIAVRYTGKLIPCFFSWIDITEELISVYPDKFFWSSMQSNPNMPEAIVRNRLDIIDWELISFYKKSYSNEFLEDFKDKINWGVANYNEIPEEFIQENDEIVDLIRVSWDKKGLSEEFLRKYGSLSTFYNFVRYQELPLNLLDEWSDFFTQINVWDLLPVFQFLPEKFLRKYKRFITWEMIHWEKLRSIEKYSVSFFEDFSDVVCWKEVSLRGKLTKDFVFKHIDKMKIIDLLINDNIDYETKKDLIDIMKMVATF